MHVVTTIETQQGTFAWFRTEKGWLSVTRGGTGTASKAEY
jgi:hypothetical protein